MADMLDIDLERAPRNQLIDHICDLESELTAWRGEDVEQATLRLSAMFSLTGNEARLLNVLKSGRPFTSESLLSILYSGQADDAPLVKIISVLIYNIRRKLAPYGIIIETLWGVGYQIKGDSLEKIVAVAHDDAVLPQPEGLVAKSPIPRSIMALLTLIERADAQTHKLSLTAPEFADLLKIQIGLSYFARFLERKGFLEVLSAPAPGGCDSGARKPWSLRITEKGLQVASVWQARS